MSKLAPEKNKNKFALTPGCPLRQALEIIKGKWKISIVHKLWDGKKRFKELERLVEGITPKMLIQELKDLERNGLVKREQFHTIPPTVEYELTPLGKELESVVASLYKFGQLMQQEKHTG